MWTSMSPSGSHNRKSYMAAELIWRYMFLGINLAAEHISAAISPKGQRFVPQAGPGCFP